ncbi:hypothetical protein ACQFG6_003022 [Klebsiella michiganensis]|jgi:uncharacterized protein involved in tellurium resistance|uniref:hypothetical protein n=1 Tax=Klebsiella michiganensis TaxID=1134687 RepID=UPI001CCFE760|nr:hypothetical protein [Klebsiella michiganensis]DAI63442.1 MAG TPA: hypothetical protein [Caudoviricetes sp.]HEE0701246.1 hypothetical protein [Klebsiella pneumoniae]ELT9740106.1 hypothetical protein [Klebsiella michiganensis]MBZ7422115.1 hypothetical protein [Klebsiella michiganensis]MBZ7767673.1 hypothetical protein [Klebsiella michiganensis]
MNIIKWLLTKHQPKTNIKELDMTAITISLTIADVAKIVNDNSDIKAAVIAKYLETNAPELVIPDLPVVETVEPTA